MNKKSVLYICTPVWILLVIIGYFVTTGNYSRLRGVYISQRDSTDKDIESPLVRHKEMKTEFCPSQIRNLSTYSLTVSMHDIERCKTRLPHLLGCYKNPCWMEKVPKGFTYATNYYWNLRCFRRDEKYYMKAMSKILSTRCSKQSEDCWRIRCYPYFYVLGPPKAGTTDLYSSLTKHPQIVRNVRKESQFWPRARHGILECGRGKATFADFLDLFDYPGEQIRKRSERNSINTTQHNHIVGEYTPANYYLQHHWHSWPGNENQTEPRVILANLLYSLNPHTKVIFSIREPVERAISHYFFGNGDPENVHSFFLNSIERFRRCEQIYSTRYCMYNQVSPQLSIGIYYIYIRDWYKVFPADQVHTILFDEYKENRTDAIDRITDFLEIDRVPRTYAKNLNKKPVVLRGKKKRTVSLETRQLLQDFYRPWNEQLVKLLKDKRFKWNY